VAIRYRKIGQRPAHVVIAERALGKPLPAGAQVHHVDGDRYNNNPTNLVVCQDQSYHWLLHRRRAALIATGDPNKVRCWHCQAWDDPDLVPKRGTGTIHRDCLADLRRKYPRRGTA
jgi:hypothetical protein